jgi:hypothetical protein
MADSSNKFLASSGDFSKFITPNLKHMKYEGRSDAMSNPKELGEEKALQKIVTNDSNMPISVAAIGIGLVSLAAMLGFRMRRGLQSATVFGSDMSVAMAPASGDNSLELETQGSASQNSRSVGWGQMSSQNSSPLTPCYAFGSFGQKKAEPSTPARRPTSSGMSEMPSAALPWTTTTLTGELVGDVGFDPLGFSKYAPGAWWFGDEGDGSLKIFREAELMHGRIAQLACLGFVFPEIAHFPGNEALGQDAFGVMNPFLAVDAVPKAGWYQILAFMVSLEVLRLNRLKDPDYIPGDLGLGQGPGRWNPFGFEYTAEEYAEKQLQEIKHCRLAMLGIVGLASKASDTDIGVLQQLGDSFSSPEFTARAGFYFPEGI